MGEDKKKPKDTRKGMGSQVLPTIRKLMSSSEQWFTVTSSSSYHFPGVFQCPHPQRMGYCSDITQLPSYERSDPDFIFTDIQLGKGKARNQREIVMTINGQEETVLYRVVPCGGVKLCPQYGEACRYVVSTRETRRCPDHPTKDLQRSSQCPVEFVYIKPRDPADNRRWITGVVCGDKLAEDNLHNHPLHGDVKIPAKVDSDIRRAVIDNPQLKTQDLVIGTGMNYMPGAACLAATHRGKIKNIRLSTLRDASQNLDQRSCILDFEKEAIAHDKKQKPSSEGNHLDEYAAFGHPYISSYSLTDSLNWVLCMNPLMAKMLSEADFVEVDITYRASVEMEYLFNVVTFNYTTMRWMTVARVRLNKLTTEAYSECFKAIFSAVAKYHPSFSVGKSLVGIIMDWSDQQFNGLEQVVGKDVAEAVVKGCQVHFMRSVKRVAHTVCDGDSMAYDAFKAIGYQVLKAESADEISILFQVLGGKLPLEEALQHIPKSKALQSYSSHHNPNNWQASAKWSEWWTRPRHLKMLSAATSRMDPATFYSLPSSTNAVEFLHRVSKGKHPDVLKVALMTTYKVDMACALEHIAATKHIPTSYELLTPDVRAARSKAAKRARAKRMRECDSSEGPPDKRSDFAEKKSRKRSKTESDKAPKKQQRELHMTDEDRKILATGGWLTDAHIQIATQILKKQFPEQKGLQDTKFLALSRAEQQGPGSVQIHHNGSNHWVVSSKKGRDVLLYDSRYTGEELPQALKEQLQVLYGPKVGRVLIPRVKQQEGSNDCGCFAIVNCYLLCKGEDPAKHRPEQNKLRDYILSCFEERQFGVLPSKTITRTARPDIQNL